MHHLAPVNFLKAPPRQSAVTMRIRTFIWGTILTIINCKNEAMCGPRLSKLFMIKGNNVLELTERCLDATTYCGWLLQPIKGKVSEWSPTLTLGGAGVGRGWGGPTRGANGTAKQQLDLDWVKQIFVINR